MKAIVKIIFYMAILMSVLAAGCEYEAEESDYFNFTIIGNGGPFHGSYKVDSDDLVNFISEPSGIYYEIYEKNLTSPGVVTITADANNASVTSLRIYIYEGSDVVDSASEYKDEEETIGLELTHTFSSSEE